MVMPDVCDREKILAKWGTKEVMADISS
jgi:hypothetical protein